MSSASLCLIMFQNVLGWYFKISGSLNCSFALLDLHVFLKFAYALCVSLCFFPNLRFFCLYKYFISLHSSSYQGAKCFYHLFGFFWLLAVVVFTTPAYFASVIKKSSIFCVRSSLF